MTTSILPSTFEKIMVCNNNYLIFNKHNYFICNHYMLLNRQRDTNNSLLQSES